MPFTARESLLVIFSSSASERGLIIFMAFFQRALSFKKKNIDKKIRKNEKRAERVEVKILAMLFVIREIMPEIFSYKLKEMPWGRILLIELFIESMKEKLFSLFENKP